MGILAACVAVTAVLATLFAGRGKPGWLDSVMDPRLRASQARSPAVVNWLPDLGTVKPVTLMTLALVLACVTTRRWSGAILAAIAEPAATGNTMRRFVAHRCLQATRGSPMLKTLNPF